MRLAWHRRREDALDCREVARVLQTYLDHELDQYSVRKVSRHLEVCRRCGLEASTYRQLKQRLSDLSRPVDPEVIERLRNFADKLTDHAGTASDQSA
ncbi:MAG: zf-HC2 domain-containing protein [Actinomycetota bacterium]|nr:zf-HC2 domain-containing protein [Actinomycetota bacterium]